MSYSGIRILNMLPGAWSWMAIPLRRLLHRWRSPEEGSSPSWTLRPPQLGGLPFLSSPRWRGRGFFFLLLVFGGGGRFGVVGR